MSEVFVDIENEIGKASPVRTAVNAFLRVRDLESGISKIEIIKTTGSLPRYELKVICNEFDSSFLKSNMDKLNKKYEFLHCFASVCDSGETGMIISKNEGKSYKTMMSRGYDIKKTTVVFDNRDYVLDENTTWYVARFSNEVSEVWSGVRDFIEHTESDVPYYLVREKPRGDEISRKAVSE